jgi:hypothetical protein
MVPRLATTDEIFYGCRRKIETLLNNASMNRTGLSTSVIVDRFGQQKQLIARESRNVRHARFLTRRNAQRNPFKSSFRMVCVIYAKPPVGALSQTLPGPTSEVGGCCHFAFGSMPLIASTIALSS